MIIWISHSLSLMNSTLSLSTCYGYRSACLVLLTSDVPGTERLTFCVFSFINTPGDGLHAFVFLKNNFLCYSGLSPVMLGCRPSSSLSLFPFYSLSIWGRAGPYISRIIKNSQHSDAVSYGTRFSVTFLFLSSRSLSVGVRFLKKWKRDELHSSWLFPPYEPLLSLSNVLKVQLLNECGYK